MGSNQDGVAIAAEIDVRNRSLGIREKLPVNGLMEYWYPAMVANKVGTTKPASLKIGGKTIVLFRDTNGEVVAIDNLCTHRGAYMSHGRSHFKGTLSCPYHGWTFNAKGELLAVLGEGPESDVPGSRGTAIRSYPTKTLMGVVFVWMGEWEPAPPEQDIPPELFDDKKYLVMVGERVWHANWRPGIENYSDAHVYYVHRNSLEVLFQAPAGLLTILHSGPNRPELTRVNDRALVFKPGISTVLNYADRTSGDKARDEVGRNMTERPLQDVYPKLQGQKFPLTNWRMRLARIAGVWRGIAKPMPNLHPPGTEWASGLHLPCIVRVDYRRLMFTRYEVPIDENQTNNFYFFAVRRRGPLNTLFWKAYFALYFRWKMIVNFSEQDAQMAAITDYSAPERLTGTDKFLREWRRLIIDCARKPTGKATE